MNLRHEGYARGRQAGATVNAAAFFTGMANSFTWLTTIYPTLGDIDLPAEVLAYDRERLACEPDYGKFPELKGLIESHLGEREGFKDASGLDDAAVAFQFSYGFYFTRRVNARHVAYWENLEPIRQCTNVFFPEGKDGITISDNRDDILRPDYYEQIPAFRVGAPKAGTPISPWQGGVSSASSLDEEPECSFPCNPHGMMPDECFDDIHAMVEFMTRYREFWGPGNQVWVDRKLNAVAVEKMNCRVAYRWPSVAGAICTTACSYLDPELHAFKQSCLRRVIAAKGQTEETCPDWQYDLGSHLRNKRLLKLTNAEAARPGGATLWGAFNAVADTAVPFPDRVCLAGEPVFPDPNMEANWTLTQHAMVLTGPYRRALYRSMQDLRRPQSIINYTPKLALGEGVEMQPEWQRDVDEGKCVLVSD